MSTWVEPLLLLVLLTGAIGSVYSYFLYPLLLRIAAGPRAPAPANRAGGAKPEALTSPPPMSLIIAAFNEAERIDRKIRNSLAIEYPSLEIIVASDASDDGTDDVVRRWVKEDPGRMRLVRSPQRQGKEEAQRLAIESAQGDVLVFTDVGTELSPDSLRTLAGYFADPTVGAVSSEDRFLSSNGAVTGEGAYVRYEMSVRRLESRLAGLVGLSGSFFAARREVCTPWDTASPSDFVTALNCSRSGLRAVNAPDVHGFYRDLSNPGLEYTRKVRTVLRGMTGLARHRTALSPRMGGFAWQLWSHKVMRWAAPGFMLLVLAASAGLVAFDARWLFVLIPQVLFWGLAGVAHLFAPLRSWGPLRTIHFFAVANLAILHAAVAFALGRRMTRWQPSRRQPA